MFCPRCGSKIHDASLYCASCGTRLSDLGVAPVGGDASTVAPATLPRVASVSPAIGAAAEASAVNVYGGFWRRVGASIIDSLILYAVIFVVILLAPSDGTSEEKGTAGGLLLLLAPHLIAWLYSAVLESSSRQATLGKMAFGIKVTDLNGQRLGFGRATGRYFGKYISSITLGVGFVMAAFTQRRQALHDKIAGTLVLLKDTDTERLAAIPVAPKVATWAIVLLILVAGVVPVTGMLAAIAIPAYQDYMIRTQVADGIASAADYKTAVARAIVSGMDLEQITSEALRLEERTTSKYLKSIYVSRGVVLLTFGGEANSGIAGARLLLVPGFGDSGEIIWVCGHGDAPDGAEFVTDVRHSDVEPKYLPAACRP